MRHSHLMTMSRFSFSECALLSVVMERAVGTHLAEARSTMYVLWYLLQAHTQIAIDHSVHAGWSMLPLLLFTFVFGCGVYACVCACGTDVSVNLIRLQNWFQELWNIQSRFARSTNAAYARILSAHMILLYQLKYTHTHTKKQAKTKSIQRSCWYINKNPKKLNVNWLCYLTISMVVGLCAFFFPPNSALTPSASTVVDLSISFCSTITYDSYKRKSLVHSINAANYRATTTIFTSFTTHMSHTHLCCSCYTSCNPTTCVYLQSLYKSHLPAKHSERIHICVWVCVVVVVVEHVRFGQFTLAVEVQSYPHRIYDYEYNFSVFGCFCLRNTRYVLLLCQPLFCLFSHSFSFSHRWQNGSYSLFTFKLFMNASWLLLEAAAGIVWLSLFDDAKICRITCFSRLREWFVRGMSALSQISFNIYTIRTRDQQSWIFVYEIVLFN